jgi:hypothetical protein
MIETETEMTRIPPGIDSPKMGRTGYGMHVISFPTFRGESGGPMRYTTLAVAAAWTAGLTALFG